MGHLILGRYLLTGTGEVREHWGVAFENGIIVDIADHSFLKTHYPNCTILDYTDRIIAPGFINAHMHLYGVLSHGIKVPAEITDFRAFLEDFWWPCVEDRLDHRMIEVTTRAMALELLNSGVTTFCDVLEAPMAIPGALDVEAAVLEDLGMKAVLSFEASERVDTENGLLGIEENRKFFEKYRENPLISGMMCLHTTFTCSKDFIKKAMEASKACGSGIQMHLSESRYEPDVCLEQYGKLPVELYEELGFFNKQILASQGVKLTEKEQDILKKRSVNLVHVPLSNCEVGGGFSPVPAMLEKGINVALGTDGYINNFFEVMRGAFLLHKANLENPEAIPAETVFKMATQNGGKALGLNGWGVLQKGSPADMITIKPVLPTPLNADNIYTQVILYCNPQDVKEVFVNGKLLKQDGKLIGTDLATEYQAVKAEAERLWGATLGS